MKQLGLVIAAGVMCASAATAGPAEPVIAAERAFAADAAKRGWIAAFKKYSAPDAVVFQPSPVSAKGALAKQPDEPADTSLKWWPVWAGIASSGDLGFTTGPYTGGKASGHYFTVWQKQPDGTWAWIFDGGPRSEVLSPLGSDTEPGEVPVSASSSGTAAWGEVAALEETITADAASNTKTAYLKHLAPDARIMGSPAQPATDAATRAEELDRHPATLQLTPLGGRASSAGDLVFTYAAATWTRDGEARQGHTARIWQKRAGGWVLLFDELLAAPPKKPG